jgi:hypothetical protein
MRDFFEGVLELLASAGVFLFILWGLNIEHEYEISLILGMFYKELIHINRNLKNKL